MTKHTLAIVAFVATMLSHLSYLAAQPPLPLGTYQAWLKHRDAVRKDASLARYYTFEALSETAGEVPNLAGKGGSLTLASASGEKQPRLTLVPGRWPEKKAARLDTEVLSGEAFPVVGNTFALTAWIRTHGQGAIQGDSVRDGGTLFSTGSGYWDGFRVTLRSPSGIFGFEIGRPQPSHSVGIQAPPLPERRWHHLAATWDGKHMRLYLDGQPAARGDHAGPYAPPPQGGAFRIGFAGSGWGSVVLDVDELAVYGRALSEEEILCDAHFYAPRAKDAAEQLALARKCRDAGELNQARKHYEQAAGMSDALPWQLQEARTELAHVCFAAHDHVAARAAYASAMAAPGVPVPVKSHSQLRIAASFARQKDYAAARSEYGKLAAITDAPPHHRDEARECLKMLERIEAGKPARDPAASRIELPRRPAPGVEFFVAPSGSDQNPGTRERPFATPERARDAIRQLRGQGKLPAGGAAVSLRGGQYPRKETFVLAAEDGGTAESPIVYRAVAGEAPVLSGGTRIVGFQPIRDAAIRARLSEESRGKVLQSDLKSQGIRDYGELQPRGFGKPACPVMEIFCDGKPLQMARWPNEGFTRVGRVIDAGGAAGGSAVFEYEGARPARWSQAADAWLFGYWHHLWADGTLGIAAIDPKARQIKTAQPYTYGPGVVSGRPYWVFNLLEEIDSPGEWYVDRKTGVLYVWPPTDPAKTTFEVSMLAAPLVKIDGASHVTLEGLVLELGRGDGIVVSGGDHCLLAGCTVRRLGGDAVTIRGGANHGILSCDLHTLGRGGARIQGGDRKTLAPSGHFLENCHVWNFSRVDRTYTPALWGDGVAIRVAHNRFHGSPGHGMRLEGNDHVVEFNEVYDVVTESDDQAGMEMFGNPTYRGVVFRYNYYHDLGNDYGWPCGQAGIRLDDAICGVLMYGNVFRRCSTMQFGGIQIHGGKENVVENNVFVDCKQAVSFSGWGKQRWAEFLAGERTVRNLQEVNAAQPPYGTRYPALAHLADTPDVNMVWRNLAVRCGALLARDRGIQDVVGNVVTSEASGFGDAKDNAFRLPADPAVLEAAGLQPIPFEEIGLYRDEYRKKNEIP